jgi:hypothetical protein
LRGHLLREVAPFLLQVTDNMANILCTKCGASWTNDGGDIEGQFTARLFSTPNNPVGSYLSVNQIIASGETLLSCPKDPQNALDEAIQRKGQGPRSQARITGRRDPSRTL